MVNIYVGNLPYTTTEGELQEAFGAYGEVSRVKVVVDRETARSRGFGFVEMATDADAEAAIKALNGADFGGRKLIVNKARPKPA